LIGLTLGAVLPVIVGCNTGNDQNVGTGVRIQALVAEGTDVSQIRYDIAPCGGAPIISVVRPIDDQTIPGTNPSLQNNPLAAGSSHRFADLFQVLAAGCYDITATPLDANGNPSTVCAPGSQKNVMVTPGETTDVFILNQCQGTDTGAVDVTAALNSPPQITALTFDGSKFVCGSPGRVCVTAQDPNNDPMQFVLTAPAGCTVVEGPVGPNGDCWNISCPTPGRANLTVQVFDEIFEGGMLVRVEDFLAAQGNPAPSHATLNFFANFDGVQRFPDRDGDGFGDANSPPQLVCPTADQAGLSDNNLDCNDNDATIHPGAVEICGDHIDNNCNGQIDEGCAAGVVGYYDMVVGAGDPNQVPPIVAAGGTPLQIVDLSPAELSQLSVLVVQNPDNNTYGAEYLANLPNVAAAVSAGMVLEIHDRFVTDASTILPGGNTFTITRFLGTDINVIDNTTLITNGPGGVIDDTTLDGGNFSLHGFGVQGTLPGDSVNIFNDGNPGEIVDFCYRFGAGAVLYSTIPLDFYLAGNGTNPNFAAIYAPNAMAYGIAGACKAH
jgi:hypothetical protein